MRDLPNGEGDVAPEDYSPPTARQPEGAERTAGDVAGQLEHVGGRPSAATPLGVVLAGGASVRMGRDKAALRYRGHTLAAWAAKRLQAAGLAVVIADRGRGTAPPWASIVDLPGREGPGAALLGVARVHPGRPLVVLACDLPLIRPALLRDLAALVARADVVVPCPGGVPDPLVAAFGPRALVALSRLPPGSGPRALLQQVALVVHRLEPDELARRGHPVASFANLNTPAEAARWLDPVAGTEP